MSEADDAPPVALYDFLYKDEQCIDSYYAQIFRGLLTSVEDSKTEHQTLSRQAKMGAAVVSGQVQMTRDTLTGSTSSIAPHDMATTDMLAYLIANDHLDQRVQEAGHGALILAKGTLVFVDRLMAEFAVTSLRIATEQERSPNHNATPADTAQHSCAMHAQSQRETDTAGHRNTRARELDVPGSGIHEVTGDPYTMPCVTWEVLGKHVALLPTRSPVGSGPVMIGCGPHPWTKVCRKPVNPSVLRARSTGHSPLCSLTTRGGQ